MAEVTDDQIAEAIAGPAEIDVDGQRVKNRSVDELIKAAEYLAAKNRTRSRNPLRTHPLSPPGTQ